MDNFWRSITDQIVENFGWGKPETWKEETIKLFLAKMEEKLLTLCQNDHQLAEKCGVPFIKGRYAVELLKIITPSTFRRIFQYQKSSGQTITKNQFAIYFDASSAEDYINTKNIKPKKIILSRKEFKVTWKGGVAISVIVLLLMVQLIIPNKENNQNSLGVDPSHSPIQNSVLETKGANSPIIIGRDVNINYSEEEKFEKDSLSSSIK